jgi:SSS family solute:Na+ symporter
MGTRAAIGIGLILYVLSTTAVSFFMMKRVRKPADYLVAGRGLPVWVLLGTIVGTCIGTGVLIGGSGLAYEHGWAGCAYPIGLGLGTVLAGLFFAGMRRYQFMTLSEEIACYYEGKRPVVEFCNISLFISQLCWLTVQIMGGAAVLGAVTGLPRELCTVLAGFAKAIISIPGGLKAVVYTDVLQTVILFCGFGFLLHSALGSTGGLAGLRDAVPPKYFSFLGNESFGAWNVFSLILVLALNPIADPGRRLTMYSAKSESGARWSMLAYGLVVMIFSVVIGVTGMYAFKLNPTIAFGDRDQALPWLITHELPPWLAAFVVVAVVAGMSSAANGNAAAVGTFFVRHIFSLVTGRTPKAPVVAARRLLACAFLFSTVLALGMTNIVEFVKKFLPLTMSGLAVIILLGRFCNCATWQGALAALIATPVVSLIVMFTPALAKLRVDSTIPATVVGIVALVIVSLMTDARRRSFDEVAEAMKHERQAIEGLPHDLAPDLAPAQPKPATCD